MKIKDCGNFCSNEDDLLGVDVGHFKSGETEWRIECPECGSSENSYESEDDCIEKWNEEQL